MNICYATKELRLALAAQRMAGKTIAVVPTMGNLHAGHIKLVTTAVSLADVVVASIFVNPLQFGRDEDLDKYPRTPLADIDKLTDAGCHYLFTPPVTEIYPNGLEQHTTVTVPGISERHCGASRPGHFDGVATVVCKLFNLVQPDHAIFGLKDYQQFQVIRKMTEDLCFDIQLTGVATERDEHGLALSSRNSYLSITEKHTAHLLSQTLRNTAAAIRQGSRNFRELEENACTLFREAGINPDYFAICDALTLAPADPFRLETQADAGIRLVILLAAFVGSTRLIDNIEIDL